MDQEVLRKINEVIGLLKLVEREIAGYGLFEEKRHIASQRAPDIFEKYKELNELIALKGSDEITNKYHKQLSEEISRILDVKEPVHKSAMF